VSRAKLGRRQRPHGAVGTVEHTDGADRLGHLLAVRADVLDRGGADRARDPRQALHAGQAAGHALGDERVPRLAGGDIEGGARACDAPSGDPHHGPREALVGDDDVRAARQHEQRLAGPIGVRDGVDHRPLARGLQVAGRGAAEAQGRQLAQAHGASG
jgi:hypothetical protein